MLLWRRDRRRLEWRGSFLRLPLRTEEVAQGDIEHIDLVADLREPHRTIETILDGFDLGLIPIDGDEVEIALGFALDLNQLVGAKRLEPVGMVERARGF